MKKNTALAIIILLSMTLALFSTACSNSGAASAPAPAAPTAQEQPVAEVSETFEFAPVELRCGFTVGITDPIGITLEKVAAELSEKSNGAINLTLFPSEQLGNNNEMAEAVTMGNLDIMMANFSTLSGWVPELDVMSTPYLFDGREHLFKVLDGHHDYIVDKIETNMPVKILGPAWENGERVTFNSVKPIKSAEDIKGMKLRTMSSSVYVKAYEKLGVIPTPMNTGEIYSGIEQGIVVGSDNNIPMYYKQSWYQVAPYLTLDAHGYTPLYFMMNEDVWNGLQPEAQKLIVETLESAVSEERSFYIELEQENLELLKDADVTIVFPEEVDTESFTSVLSDVYTEIAESIGGTELLEIVMSEKG